MGLLEYIKKNYRNPNVGILRDLGASEVLIDYLVKTSHNTNFNIVPQLIDSGEEDWILVAESIGFGRIVWDSTGEIVWTEGEINCEKFALLEDIFVNPYCYRAFFKTEESQEFPVHYNGSSTPGWGGGPDFNKRVSITYDSTAFTPINLTMQVEAGTKCQLYIKKVEEVETFTINWDNDYQIYTNINIGDVLVSPSSPPLEPGYIFSYWDLWPEKIEENKDFTFISEMVKDADETKTTYAGYYAYQPEP